MLCLRHYCFLCVGVVIHENKSFQDVRSLGHGWSRYPVSISCLVVAMFSLCGVPFISGFYSKDCIVERGLLFWSVKRVFCNTYSWSCFYILLFASYS